MAVYIHQLKDWPNFYWEEATLGNRLTELSVMQGRLLGRMEALGFALRAEASLNTLTLDVIKSSEIEGELLDPESVRTSVARRLGMDVAALDRVDKNVEGVVEMMLNATQEFDLPLSADRLFGWHTSLFPGGRSGMQKISVGNWRNHSTADPLQVVSGAMGRERVHFQAPDSELLDDEMQAFLNWFNQTSDINPFIKAGLAHLWFVTVHPFDDGNGRIARAIADMQLARADRSSQRFYSMSAQIRKERNAYYAMLEETQRSSLDVTPWLTWFLDCLQRALLATDTTLGNVLKKAEFWKQHVMVSLNERQKLMLNKLLDGFEGKLTSSKWAKLTKSSSDTAIRDLNDLVQKNLLVKDVAGGRSTNYILVH